MFIVFGMLVVVYILYGFCTLIILYENEFGSFFLLNQVFVLCSILLNDSKREILPRIYVKQKLKTVELETSKLVVSFFMAV